MENKITFARICAEHKHFGSGFRGVIRFVRNSYHKGSGSLVKGWR